jgi:hypothetical protein
MDVKEIKMLDINDADTVQVYYDGKALWVNVDGVCVLRSKHAKITATHFLLPKDKE